MGSAVLNGWAWTTALATFVLIWSGGLVTSKGVGMAVPDWPTTFGYNMFLFPVSQWVGGIFYEHSHRLIASGVGLMTVILAIGTFVVEPRRWVRILSVWLVVGVVTQGLLGGLRVVLNRDHVGILHGILAQSFFCALLIFCVATMPAFLAGWWAEYDPDRRALRLARAALALVFAQLVLGATMRHEHIGLAIPDFPLAYGRIIPDTSPAALEEINATRAAEGGVPLHAHFIWIHMAHRLNAIFALCAVAAFFWSARASSNAIRRMSAIWLAAVVAQFALGAWTVLSGKAADIATAHVALGTLTLAWGVLINFRLQLGSRAGRFVVPDIPANSRAPTVV
jgi:heme a synthase